MGDPYIAKDYARELAFDFKISAVVEGFYVRTDERGYYVYVVYSEDTSRKDIEDAVHSFIYWYLI